MKNFVDLETLENFVLPLRPVLIFVVVLARVGGLVTFAPFWGHRAANAKIRIVLAFVLSLALTPVLMSRLETPPSDIGPLTLVLLGELIIGIILGFVGRLVFTGFELGAHLFAAQMGFSLAGTVDPSTQAQTTAFGTIAQMLGLMTLLAANGHHWFLAATVKSFSTTAPGAFTLSPELLDTLFRFSGTALVTGVSLAAPAIIVLLSVEFALEFFGRTAPQFQVFILGFPFKIGIGLWLAGASLYFLPNACREVLAGIYSNLVHVLGMM